MIFDCEEGFILKGSSLIHCGEDNDWDPPPPICELSKYGPWRNFNVWHLNYPEILVGAYLYA